jgi:hypothetical protein
VLGYLGKARNEGESSNRKS